MPHRGLGRHTSGRRWRARKTPETIADRVMAQVFSYEAHPGGESGHPEICGIMGLPSLCHPPRGVPSVEDLMQFYARLLRIEPPWIVLEVPFQ